MRHQEVLRTEMHCLSLLLLVVLTGFISGDEGDLISVNGTGIYKKVIVRVDNARLYDEPNDQGKFEVVKSTSILFRISTPDGQEQQGNWVRVGTGNGKPLGWMKQYLKPEVPENQDPQLIDWNTRFVLKPLPPKMDKTSQKSKTLVVSGSKPRYTATWRGGAGQGQEVVVPILAEPSENTEKGNPEYQVALFKGVTQTKSSGGLLTPGTTELSTQDTRLEIVFVIDTTRSMTPLILGTVEVAKRCVKELEKNPEARKYVRFGLVEYRDCTPEIKFITRLKTTLGDATNFEAKVAELQVAVEPSDGVEEDVVAGLLEALGKAGWAQNSSKHIVLLGDASAHLPPSPRASTGKDIGWVITQSRRRTGTELEKALGSTNIHAVQAIQPGEPEDRVRCRQQFQEFAKNGGDFEGYFIEFDPNEEAEVRKVVEGLSRTLSLAFDGLVKLRKGVPVSPGAPGGGDTQIVKALWDIQQAANETIGDVEVGTTQIMTTDGDELAQQAVQVNEDDLIRLESTLKLLHLNLKDAKGAAGADVSEIVEALKTTVSQSLIGQHKRKKVDVDAPDANTQLDRLITNLPLKTDVLKLTPAGLAQMTPEGFKDWLARLEDARSRAASLLATSQWQSLSDKAANKKYAYILLSSLP